MVDVFDKEKRSKIMALSRSRGSKSTEERFRQLLLNNDIEGWRDKARDLFGNPDFVFDNRRLVIFIDGCFWHGCAECKNIPADNHEFWDKKINRTRERDREVTARLTIEGWRVIRVWEHALKKKNLESTLTSLRQFFQEIDKSETP